MSLSDVLGFVNTASEGYFGVVILIIIFFIMFVRNKNSTPTREAIVGSMHAVIITAIPLAFLGLLSDLVLGIVIVGWAGSIIMLTNRE